MFTERTGAGIFFVGDPNAGERPKSDVIVGDSVTLHVNDEQVLVRVTASTKPGFYKGTIYGFTPSYGSSFGELEMGQEVEFMDIHIFGCS